MRSLLICLLLAAPLSFHVACSEAQASSKVVTKTLKVDGMTCEACEHAIKRGVGKLDGVKDCTASAKDGTATITFDEAAVDQAAIAKTIEKIGYTVETVH